jgi:hypothetical protein
VESPCILSKDLAMTNYLSRLIASTALTIQRKILDGIVWDISDFEEFVRYADSNAIDRRSIRKGVYAVLSMIPRMRKEDKSTAWKEISKQYLPNKSHTVSKADMTKMSSEDVTAHIAKVFAEA